MEKGGCKMNFKDTIFRDNFKKVFKLYKALIFFFIALELFMIVRSFFVFNLHQLRHIIYFTAYIIFLVVAVIGAIICVRYQKDIDKHINIYYCLSNFFAIFILSWSLLISCLDGLVGNMPLVFITIMMSVASLALIKPLLFTIYCVIFSLIYLVFTLIFGKFDISQGFLINFLVYVFMSIIIIFRINVVNKKNYLVAIEMNKIATVDSLTKTYNRRALDLKVEELSQQNVEYCYVILDVDNFKKINDTYGHKVGDEALVFITQVLTNYFPNSVYRYGGDEFTILSFFDPIKLNNIFININKDLLKYSTDIELTISYGFSIVNSSMTPIDVFIKADQSLYNAKNNKKNFKVI